MNEIKSITGDILLDAGTNELEVLVFSLCGGWFGVNVAKVREVIRPVSTVATPHQHPSVVGMFNIRGHVVPVVDLAKHLGLSRPEGGRVGEGRVIITEFNSLRTGFLVDTVEQIHRMSWSRVKPAPDLSVAIAGGGGGAIGTTTGMIEMNDRLVQMIDFESVADAILVEKRLHIEKVENPDGVERESKRVVIAEDSPFMRQLLQDIFVASGYTRVEVYADGEQAWNAIQKGGAPIDAIVSDIEMPRMDGLHLTKRIKATPALAGTRVVLFSSLITPDNLKKGRQVGADAQVSKPELAEMVRLVDRVVTGRPIDGDLQRAA
ncbi:MAG: chemotaxis protein CheV [Phycisphaerae bacterium]|nr:chemotaxis protein CheV [Phycisphaerae bacterium]